MSGRSVRMDVDTPAGQLGGESGVLTFLADCQRQLVVGNDHLGRTRFRVDDLDGVDPRRRERRRPKGAGILREVHNVDLLTVQLSRYRPDPRPHRTDAGPLRVDTGDLGMHGDLGPVPCLAGQCPDLDSTVRNLGNLELEQLANQVGVGPRQADLGSSLTTLHADHETTKTLTVDVLLPRNLLGQRHRPLDLSEVHHHVARITALLDDARDDVTLTAMEVAHDRLVLDVAQSLHNDLASRRSRDPPETSWSVVELGAGLRTLPGLGVQDAVLAGPHSHVTGLALQLHPGDALGAVAAVIGHEHRLLDGRDDDVQGDVPFALKAT